jgi:hypothetical protein
MHKEIEKMNLSNDDLNEVENIVGDMTIDVNEVLTQLDNYLLEIA